MSRNKWLLWFFFFFAMSFYLSPSLLLIMRVIYPSVQKREEQICPTPARQESKPILHTSRLHTLSFSSFLVGSQWLQYKKAVFLTWDFGLLSGNQWKHWGFLSIIVLSGSYRLCSFIRNRFFSSGLGSHTLELHSEQQNGGSQSCFNSNLFPLPSARSNFRWISHCVQMVKEGKWSGSRWEPGNPVKPTPGKDLQVSNPLGIFV